MECKLLIHECCVYFAHGFNRNIVECKYNMKICRFDFLGGFNRNIVECKYGMGDAQKQAALVLIETLWNVNVLKRR